MKNKSKGSAGIAVLVTLFVLFILGLFVFGIFYNWKTPSSGQHTGIVTSVEQNGLIWHTWSAYIKTSAQSTQEDRYCVTDPAVVAELQKYADGVTEVIVHYDNRLLVPVQQCKNDDQSIITSVEKQ